jgi:hypothetical protein
VTAGRCRSRPDRRQRPINSDFQAATVGVAGFNAATVDVHDASRDGEAQTVALGPVCVAAAEERTEQLVQLCLRYARSISWGPAVATPRATRCCMSRLGKCCSRVFTSVLLIARSTCKVSEPAFDALLELVHRGNRVG